MLKVFLLVLVVVVATSAAPPYHSESSEESTETPDLPYVVDHRRFHGAKKVFQHRVSNQLVDPDIFRSHHQYMQRDGTIVGEYAILAPDEDTLQIVKYTSGKAGYQAKVVHTDDLSVF